MQFQIGEAKAAQGALRPTDRPGLTLGNEAKRAFLLPGKYLKVMT